MAIKGVVACLEAVRERPRAHRQGRRMLQVERLEDRRLMYADSPLAETAVDPGGTHTVAMPRLNCAATAADADFALFDSSVGSTRTGGQKVGLAAAVQQLAEAQVLGDRLALLHSK